ncbi:MAG: MFS transporter [Candidatus Paceibacterota bacterium]
MKKISRTVWILSLVSLFTDVASEMLYPIMPIYLQSIGFSVVLIGVLEGVAEATTGLSKGYFGQLSDRSFKRTPFIQVGYAFSAISKPMMAMFVFPLWIFFARTIDRFGKGIRTGARDALLSDESTPATKGRIFGFHRSLDTLGAAIGPSLALLYLYFYPGNYQTLFFIAFIPGLLAFGTSLFLKDKRKPEITSAARPIAFFSFFAYWKRSPAGYKKVTAGLLFFTLFNSSDVFLLLKVKETVHDDALVIGIYIFYNLIYALFAYPLGIIADKIGLKTVLIAGFFLFALMYLGMSQTSDVYMFFGLFFLYGMYAAATEGVAKAWISNIVDSKDTATAIGTFSGFQSIGMMLASSLTGVVWYRYGSSTALLITAVAGILAVIYFLGIGKIKTREVSLTQAPDPKSGM